MRAFVVAVLISLGLAATAAAQDAPPPASSEPVYAQPAKPSGFWGSGRPAVGGAYRWRLLGIGVVLLGLTGFGTLRLVRGAASERTRRANKPG